VDLLPSPGFLFSGRRWMPPRGAGLCPPSFSLRLPAPVGRLFLCDFSPQRRGDPDGCPPSPFHEKKEESPGLAGLCYGSRLGGRKGQALQLKVSFPRAGGGKDDSYGVLHLLFFFFSFLRMIMMNRGPLLSLLPPFFGAVEGEKEEAEAYNLSPVFLFPLSPVVRPLARPLLFRDLLLARDPQTVASGKSALALFLFARERDGAEDHHRHPSLFSPYLSLFSFS